MIPTFVNDCVKIILSASRFSTQLDTQTHQILGRTVLHGETRPVRPRGAVAILSMLVRDRVPLKRPRYIFTKAVPQPFFFPNPGKHPSST